MIDKLEEDLEQMESLTTLIANNTAITRMPFSVVRSKSIGYISLCGHEGFSRDVFPSIIWSWMSPTNNLPSPMSSLVPLDVPNSSSHELSSISEHLPWLRSLWVDCGSEIQLSLDATIILDALYATFSKDSGSSAITSQVSNMKTSALIQSCSQVHVSGSINSLKSLLIQIGMNCEVTNALKENILQNRRTTTAMAYLLQTAVLCELHRDAKNSISVDHIYLAVCLQKTKNFTSQYSPYGYREIRSPPISFVSLSLIPICGPWNALKMVMNVDETSGRKGFILKPSSFCACEMNLGNESSVRREIVFNGEE